MDARMILYAFLFGGAVCAIGQLLIDRTSLTPARILVLYTCIGAVLFAAELYTPLRNAVGTGASLPIIGFGATIAKGVKEAIDAEGAVGIITGGLTASAAGITLSVMLGALIALFFRSRPKRM
jgi:stage V sporulation protein AE